MSGGSVEPETPRDQQCRHCGLFYAPEGIDSHEENCELQDFDRTLVPIRGDREACDPSEGASPEGVDPQDGDAERATPPEGPTPSVDDVVDDVGPIEERQTVVDPGRAAKTDGGPQELPMPDVQEDSDGPEHIIPIDEWLDRVSARRPELLEHEEFTEWVDEYRDEWDFVDLRLTDLERGVVELKKEEDIDVRV